MECIEERTKANTIIRVNSYGQYNICDGTSEIIIFSDEINEFITILTKIRDAKRKGNI